MKNPTERQLYLMKFAGPPHSFWRVCGTSSSLIRPYEYGRPGSERLPSEGELNGLIKAGWIELRDDPKGNMTESTSKKVVAKGYRVWLTEAGQKAMGL